jgi:hypothetical protein
MYLEQLFLLYVYLWAKSMAVIVMDSVTPKVVAKQELLFIKLETLIAPSRSCLMLFSTP